MAGYDVYYGGTADVLIETEIDVTNFSDSCRQVIKGLDGIRYYIDDGRGVINPRCSYCGVKSDRSHGNCDHCGAPL